MVKNLLCMGCNDAEAVSLMYFERLHGESGNVSFVDPHIYCQDCLNALTKRTDLYENRPRIVTFEKLADPEKGKRLVGWLTSKKAKGREANYLANKFWRDKLWNAHYVTSGNIKAGL